MPRPTKPLNRLQIINKYLDFQVALGNCDRNVAKELKKLLGDFNAERSEAKQAQVVNGEVVIA